MLRRARESANGQLGVLDTVILFAAFAESAAVEADDRRVAEVRIDTVEARSVGDSDIELFIQAIAFATNTC